MQRNSRHTYRKMNQDLSKSKYSPEVYYEGRNIWIESDSSQSTGSLTNTRGTSILYTIPSIFEVGAGVYEYTADGQTKQYTTDQSISGGFFPILRQSIIGMEPVRDQLIIFTTDSDAPAPTSIGCVWIMTIRPQRTLTLAYMNQLDFSTKYPIEAEARYETEDILKVYWTDRYNELRYLNLSDPDLSNTPLDFVNIVPTYEWGTLEMRSVEPGGQFTAGMVGWAYSYSNFNGQESKISPLTKLYNVNYPTDGALVGDIVGRSFRLRLNDVDTRFDLINIYRVFYTSLDAEPQITLAFQEEANSTPIELVDDYSSIIQTLSTAQFIIQGSDPFVTGTIATKNDYLFAADNEYKFFDIDFDARAYRFQGDFFPPTADLYDSQGNLEVTIDGTAPVWPTDTELDAINKSTTADTLLNYKFRHAGQPNPYYPDGSSGENPDYNKWIYQSNGLTIGGEGPNVSYTFEEIDVDVDQSTTELVSFDPENSLLNAKQQEKTGFKRDEVYRMGIVLFNNRGQQSFVKWIGDIRIPQTVVNYLGSPIATFPISDGNNNKQLQIKFEVTNLPAEIIGYQIVRVERTAAESTITAQGLVNVTGTNPDSGTFNGALAAVDSYRINTAPTGLGGAENIQTASSFLNGEGTDVEWANLWNSGSPVSQVGYRTKVCQFFSHDINEFVPLGGYFNFVSTVASKNVATNIGNEAGNYDPKYNYLTIGGSFNDAGIKQWEPFLRGGTHLVENIVRLEPDHTRAVYIPERSTNIQPIRYKSGTNVEFVPVGFFNRYIDGGDEIEHHSFLNKSLLFLVDETYGLKNNLLDTDNTTGFLTPDETSRYIIADYKQELPNQYGGPSYEARTRNVYIPSGPYVQATTSEVNAWGDSWSTYQVFQYNQLRQRTDFSIEDSARGVYQIPMECRVRHDLRVHTFLAQQLVATSFEEMFQYNTVYSQDYDLDPKGSRPLNFQEDAHRIAETAYAGPKLNGEQIDSWTAFNTGDRKDMDAKWGRIVGLHENLDTLFVFQEQAVGLWEVQPYKQTATTDGGLIELGTGAVLERRRYVTTNHGCIHKFSIAKSPYGTSYYDEYNKALRTLTNRPEKTSELKGLSVTLRNLPRYDDAPTDANGVTAIFDPDREEIITTFIGPDQSLTVQFSVLSDAYTTFHDGHPRLFSGGVDNVYCVNESDGYRLNTWGTGNRGQYFGIIYESSITLVMNDVPDIVKLLTNLKWNAECYDADGNPINDVTVSHVEVWNDYQTTGKVDVSTIDFNQFKRLMRNWLYKVPFDQDEPLSRMRSQYFFIKLYIDNTTNYEHIVHDLIATYILQPI